MNEYNFNDESTHLSFQNSSISVSRKKIFSYTNYEVKINKPLPELNEQESMDEEYITSNAQSLKEIDLKEFCNFVISEQSDFPQSVNCFKFPSISEVVDKDIEIFDMNNVENRIQKICEYNLSFHYGSSNNNN